MTQLPWQCLTVFSSAIEKYEKELKMAYEFKNYVYSLVDYSLI